MSLTASKAGGCIIECYDELSRNMILKATDGASFSCSKPERGVVEKALGAEPLLTLPNPSHDRADRVVLLRVRSAGGSRERPRAWFYLTRLCFWGLIEQRSGYRAPGAVRGSRLINAR